MGLPTYGLQAVDWEKRIDYEALRVGRLGRAKEFLCRSELGAILCFDTPNIRYVTATTIGTWGRQARLLLPVPRGGSRRCGTSAPRPAPPALLPVPDGRSPAGISTLRGACRSTPHAATTSPGRCSPSPRAGPPR
jgi:hypothetical protein